MFKEKPSQKKVKKQWNTMYPPGKIVSSQKIQELEIATDIIYV